MLYIGKASKRTKGKARYTIYDIPYTSAFTLVELLVVISIIGILIGLSIFGLQGARTSSRDSKRKADLELVRSGLEIYKSDCGVYPASLAFGSSLVGTGSPTTCAATNTYISSIPKDPIDPTNAYFYSNPTSTAYILCTSLEQAPNPPINTTGCGSCGATCNYKVTNP